MALRKNVVDCDWKSGNIVMIEHYAAPMILSLAEVEVFGSAGEPNSEQRIEQHAHDSIQRCVDNANYLFLSAEYRWVEVDCVHTCTAHMYCML